MNREQFHTVAGHTFCLIMPESEAVWQGITPAYSPFVVPENQHALFTLTVTDSIHPENVSLILKDANPRAGETKLDAYRTSFGYLFGMRTPFTDKQNGLLHISNDFRIAQVALSGNDFERLQGLNNALMFSFMLASAPMDTLLMHASAVVNGGKAYLFLGRSGTGKSTHSRLWLSSIPGTTLLNDDHPVIRINKQGKAIAYGSPWSGKTPCYHNASAPIGGIVRIKRTPENRIYPLSAIQSYASLFTSSSGISWEKELADNKDNTLQKIITIVSCWTLECLPDEEAAQLCAKTMRKEVRCNG